MITSLLAFTLLSAPARAEDVVIPDPTPRDVTDLSLAYSLQQLLVDALGSGGVDVVDGDTLKTWAIEGLDGCAESATCPGNVWPATDARIAVVLLVGREKSGIYVETRFYGADDADPFKVYRDTVKDGGEPAWSRDTARHVRDALKLLAPREIEQPELRRRGTAGPVMTDEDEPGASKGGANTSGRPKPEPDEELPDVDAPPDGPPNGISSGTIGPIDDLDAPDEAPARGTSGERRTGPGDASPRDTRRPQDGQARGGEEAALARLHLPAYARKRYEQSGLPLDVWRDRARVRSNQFMLEFQGGMGFGAVDRGYSVQALIVEDAASDTGFRTEATSTWQGAGAGTGAAASVAIAYAPTWWLDMGVLVGAQLGRNRLSANWECDCGQAGDPLQPDPARAVQAIVEPRVRLWPVATGVAKPYAIVGFTTMLRDGIVVPDGSVVTYLDAPGGASFGPMGGLGLSFDATDFFTIQLEAPVTYLLPEGSGDDLDARVPTLPAQLEGTPFLVRPTAGVAVRF